MKNKVIKDNNIEDMTNVLIKKRALAYFGMIRNLSVNMVADIAMIFSKLLDIVKLIALIFSAVLALLVMIVFSIPILPIYVYMFVKKDKAKFKNFVNKDYSALVSKVKKRDIPSRKGHQKYCIEGGFITEYFKNKKGNVETATIANVISLIGEIDHDRILKDHVLYLMTQLENNSTSVIGGKNGK